MFLTGLQKLGKGDWRGISRNFVVSRTPTQVASHAQKYFIRQTNVSRRKRRSSLFDIVADEVSPVFSLYLCRHFLFSSKFLGDFQYYPHEICCSCYCSVFFFPLFFDIYPSLPLAYLACCLRLLILLWYREISFPSVISNLKHKAATCCHLLLLWMKNAS